METVTFLTRDHADDLGGILQIMKSHTETIDRSIHRLEDSVIDGEPSLVRFDRRRFTAAPRLDLADY